MDINYIDTNLAGSHFLYVLSSNLSIDGIDAEHDSTITNPNNAMFLITNFSDVRRDLLSAFAEWSIDFDDIDLVAKYLYRRIPDVR